MSDVIKWGAIIVALFLGVRWFANLFASGSLNIQSDGGVMNAPYAAPLVTPATPVYGWAAPWQYGYGYYGFSGWSEGQWNRAYQRQSNRRGRRRR